MTISQVDPGLSAFWARNNCTENAEAVRLWAAHFSCESSSQHSVCQFSWANHFLKLGTFSARKMEASYSPFETIAQPAVK